MLAQSPGPPKPRGSGAYLITLAVACVSSAHALPSETTGTNRTTFEANAVAPHSGSTAVVDDAAKGWSCTPQPYCSYLLMNMSDAVAMDELLTDGMPSVPFIYFRVNTENTVFIQWVIVTLSYSKPRSHRGTQRNGNASMQLQPGNTPAPALHWLVWLVCDGVELTELTSDGNVPTDVNDTWRLDVPFPLSQPVKKSIAVHWQVSHGASQGVPMNGSGAAGHLYVTHIGLFSGVESDEPDEGQSTTSVPQSITAVKKQMNGLEMRKEYGGMDSSISLGVTPSQTASSQGVTSRAQARTLETTDKTTMPSGRTLETTEKTTTPSQGHFLEAHIGQPMDELNVQLEDDPAKTVPPVLPMVMWLLGIFVSILAIVHYVFWHKRTELETSANLVAEDFAEEVPAITVGHCEDAAEECGARCFYIGSDPEDMCGTDAAGAPPPPEVTMAGRATTGPEPEQELDPGATSDEGQHALALEAGLNSEGKKGAQKPGPRRLVLLYASPLCLCSEKGVVSLPKLAVEREHEALQSAYRQAAKFLEQAVQCPGALVTAKTLTPASLLSELRPNREGTAAATVLHITAHGVGGRLIYEDGHCTAGVLGESGLKDMITPDSMPPNTEIQTRLVVLAACRLQEVGRQFIECGVPHVICCTKDLPDKAGPIFFEAFYSYLLKGETVQNAFKAAIVALSHFSPAFRKAAENLVLLPDNAPHDEVLFHSQPPVHSPGNSPLGGDTIGDPGGGLRRAAAPGWPMDVSMNRAATAPPRALAGEGSTEIAKLTTVSPGATNRAPPRTTCGEGAADTDSLLTTTATGGSGGDSSQSTNEWTSDTGAVDLSSGPGSDTDGSTGREGDASAGEDRGRVRVPPRARSQRALSERPPLAMAPSTSIPPAQSNLTGIMPTPFSWNVPDLPDDFEGRSRDVWWVVQAIAKSERRAVVVCAAPDQEPGIGKTAVLDAVHRSFVRHVGWVCISARLRAGLGDAEHDNTGAAWIGTVMRAVRKVKWALQAQLRRSAGNGGMGQRRRPSRNLAGRPVSQGFHPLSRMVSDMALEELVQEMSGLEALCEEARDKDLVRTKGILLILDECDHLIQQAYFQESIEDLLRQCRSCHIVLSTHQPMICTAARWFKVVEHKLQGLDPESQAKLFLRRAHRPLQWAELIPPNQDGADVQELAADCKAKKLSDRLEFPKEMEKRVYGAIASHPAIAAQQGNPKLIIELANKVTDTDPATTLADLIP